MGLGKQIAEAMGAAVVEAGIALNVDVTEEEEPVKKKRGRKKAQKDPEEAFVWDGPETFEEFCERDIQRAHEKNLPEPDYDFRNEYVKGQRIYYVNMTTHFVNEKQLLNLTIRTIYPRMIVAVEEKSMCHCIGYNQRHDIFVDYLAAKQRYEAIGGTYGKEEKNDEDDNVQLQDA